MMYILFTALLTLTFASEAQLYKNKDNGLSVDFFSETPVENIQAHNQKVTSLINLQTDSLVFKITQTDFKFKNSLMEEHYNENYVESEKYPFSVFRGKLDQKIDPKSNKVYKVKVNGILDLHGVRQKREIEGTVEVKNNVVKLHSEFFVKLVDHKIEVPKLVFEKIAEAVKVTVDGEYMFFKMK